VPELLLVIRADADLWVRAGAKNLELLMSREQRPSYGGWVFCCSCASSFGCFAVFPSLDGGLFVFLNSFLS
jgi:hypothetical protein